MYRIKLYQHGVVVKKYIKLVAVPIMAAYVSVTQAAELELQPCFTDGVKSKALCGILNVAEDPAKALSDNNQVPLNVVVLPKFKEESKELPVMFLAGGPGQAATELAGALNTPMWELRQKHDIILIDQRGTGKSNGLRCPVNDIDGLLFDDSNVDMKEEVNKCLETFSDRYLPSYNTYQAIEDFEAVREALGHKQVHIYGGSYGTRAGFAYLKNHPESIKTAILDSNAPMSLVVGLFGKTSETAFDYLIEDCQAHEKCNEAFPNLKQDFVTLMAQLDKANIEESIYHPVSGDKVTMILSKSKVTEAMRGTLYNLASRQILPFVVNKAANGDYRSLATLIASSSASSGNPGGLYTGLTMNILCNEDFSRVTQQALKNDADNYFNGELGYSAFTDVCEFWPKWQAPENFAEPVKTDVPVLLFSGKYDPVTPPEYAEMALPGLSNAKHVVIENGSHVPSLAMCMGAVQSFIETGSFKDVDFSCAEADIARMFLTDLNQLH